MASRIGRAAGLLAAIERELECPIAWATIIPEDGVGLVGDMEGIWEDMVENSDLPNCEYLSEDDSSAELERKLAEIKASIGSLREEYGRRVYPYAHLIFADRDVYKKHYPDAGLNKDQIIARTLSGDSLFFREVTPEVLKRYMWNVFEVHSESPLITDKDESFVMQTLSEIGASKGQITTHVRIVFNRASGVVHMYPVPPSDAPAGRILVCGIDHLLAK